ncbi:fungal-specific transcription factor domain-containing protein [Podospora didyma]|uniref:Fungal-specific transcription factor domain-containing protein n=1 Tax=Podospora didyma TaxID=330526 RepID=A0AAE0K6G7_9PEZI|nr:fungal-specific transcription factor domain-containing protein [Podospora didyma]
MDSSSTSPSAVSVSNAPSIASQNHSHNHNKPMRILACVLCQHRKIKCDRNFPCSNCTKANVKCTPSTPAPARKRRRPNQDLQERLARCEELLKEYATEKPESTTPQPSQTPLYEQKKWQPAGKLVKEDGGVRFVDNFMLGVVYDELRAMRHIIDADDHEDTASSETMTPDGNSDLLIGAESPEQSVENLWPEPAHAFRLWQVYLDRVNPLTKIIHVPTLQPYLTEATSGTHNVPINIETLLLSIFLMATVALTPDEAQTILGYAREEALQRFSTAVRLNLSRMGFLKSHDLTTLQALVIYMMSLQGRYNRHAAWILNGVVIRIAQKMGLHRDGEVLGLGPFDTEMRRRLWWQIIMVDSKYAIFSGLSHALLPRNWDTKPPKNVNDVDIYPSATEPFQDREGPTEMIFCLLTCKFGKFLVESPGFESLVIAPGSEALSSMDEEKMAEFRRTIENLGKELLDLLDRFCDPAAGPVHEMAIEMRKHIITKIMEFVTPLRMQPDQEGQNPTRGDDAFRVAIGSMEHNEQNYMAGKDKGFIWFSLQLFQIDVFLYIVGQLCHRTEGPLVERAWRQVNVIYSFHPELFDVSNKVYSTIAGFVLKAWAKREETFFVRTGQLPEVPFYVEKLRASMPEDIYKTDSTALGQFTPPSLDSKDIVGVGGVADPNIEQFLGGYLDTMALDWDMFGGQMKERAANPWRVRGISHRMVI